jgi:hypothetical protein
MGKRLVYTRAEGERMRAWQWALGVIWLGIGLCLLRGARGASTAAPVPTATAAPATPPAPPVYVRLEQSAAANAVNGLPTVSAYDVPGARPTVIATKAVRLGARVATVRALIADVVLGRTWAANMTRPIDPQRVVFYGWARTLSPGTTWAYNQNLVQHVWSFAAPANTWQPPRHMGVYRFVLNFTAPLTNATGVYTVGMTVEQGGTRTAEQGVAWMEAAAGGSPDAFLFIDVNGNSIADHRVAAEVQYFRLAPAYTSAYALRTGVGLAHLGWTLYGNTTAAALGANASANATLTLPAVEMMGTVAVTLVPPSLPPPPAPTSPVAKTSATPAATAVLPSASATPSAPLPATAAPGSTYSYSMGPPPPPPPSDQHQVQTPSDAATVGPSRELIISIVLGVALFLIGIVLLAVILWRRLRSKKKRNWSRLRKRAHDDEAEYVDGDSDGSSGSGGGAHTIAATSIPATASAFTDMATAAAGGKRPTLAVLSLTDDDTVPSHAAVAARAQSGTALASDALSIDGELVPLDTVENV